MKPFLLNNESEDYIQLNNFSISDFEKFVLTGDYLSHCEKKRIELNKYIKIQINGIEYYYIYLDQMKFNGFMIKSDIFDRPFALFRKDFGLSFIKIAVKLSFSEYLLNKPVFKYNKTRLDDYSFYGCEFNFDSHDFLECKIKYCNGFNGFPIIINRFKNENPHFLNSLFDSFNYENIEVEEMENKLHRFFGLHVNINAKRKSTQKEKEKYYEERIKSRKLNFEDKICFNLSLYEENKVIKKLKEEGFKEIKLRRYYKSEYDNTQHIKEDYIYYKSGIIIHLGKFLFENDFNNDNEFEVTIVNNVISYMSYNEDFREIQEILNIY